MINLSVKTLEAFCALEETKQFTAAAKRCHVTQSAFSQIIARLEDQLGKRLFDRDTRSVRLTAEGMLFAEKARDILTHIAHSIAELDDYSNKKHGHLTVASMPSLASLWLPSLIQQFMNSFPSIIVRLNDTYSERCLSLLRENKVDLAVTAHPGNSGEFETEVLFQELFYLVAPKKAVFEMPDHLSLQSLRGVPFIHLVHTEGIRVICDGEEHLLRPLLRTFGVKELALEVEHATTLAGFVDQGLGVSVVPQSMLTLFQGENTLRILLREQSMLRPIFLVRRHWDSVSPSSQAFITLMRAEPPFDNKKQFGRKV